MTGILVDTLGPRRILLIGNGLDRCRQSPGEAHKHTPPETGARTLARL